MKLAQITITMTADDNAAITDQEHKKLAAELTDLGYDCECFANALVGDVFGDSGRVEVSIDYGN